MEHARLGASGSYKWMNCPGSLQLEDQPGAEPEGTNFFAAQGTVAHAVGERCLGDWKSPEYYEGLWGDQDGDLYDTEEEARAAVGSAGMIFEVDEEMIEAVKVYHRTVVKLDRKFKEEYPKTYKRKTAMMIEHKFDLSWLRPEMFGTNDLCMFVPGEILHVLDYKHGMGLVVEVEDNSQLLYYALGALHSLCWDEIAEEYDADLMPREVVLTVVQPRASHPDGPVRSWTVDPTYILEDFKAALADAADLARGEKPPLKTGPWCEKNFCRAKGICPALEQRTFDDLGEAFEEFDFDEFDVDKDPDKAKEAMEKHGREVAFAVADRNPERVAELLDTFDMVEAFVKSIRAFAKGEALAGREIPRHKLVRGRTHRKWEDEAAVIEALELDYGDQIFTKPKLKSPAQVEKLDEEAKALVADLAIKPEGELKLVSVTHSDPGVVINPFAGMEGGEEEEDDFL